MGLRASVGWVRSSKGSAVEWICVVKAFLRVCLTAQEQWRHYLAASVIELDSLLQVCLQVSLSLQHPRTLQDPDTQKARQRLFYLNPIAVAVEVEVEVEESCM